MRIKKSALIPLHLRVSKSARPSSKRGQWASMSFFSFRDVTLTATKPSDSRRVTLTATSASDSRIQIQTYIQRKQFLCVIRTTVARHKQRLRSLPLTGQRKIRDGPQTKCRFRYTAKLTAPEFAFALRSPMFGETTISAAIRCFL